MFNKPAMNTKWSLLWRPWPDPAKSLIDVTYTRSRRNTLISKEGVEDET